MTSILPKIRRLWFYLRPYWHLQVLMFLVMCILAGLIIALPIAIQYMIDALIPNLIASRITGVTLQPVVLFSLFLVAVFLADVFFSWLRDYLAGYVGARIIRDMRSQLFGHLERLSLKFHQEHQTGEIMSRLLSDVSRIQELLASTSLVFITNVLMLVAILAYLLTTNWMLTLVAVIPVPLTLYFTKFYGIRLNRLSMTIQRTVAALSARFQETLLSIKTVKAFGQENREKEKTDAILEDLTQTLVTNSWMNSLAVNVVNFVNMVGPIAVLGWGVYLVAIGSMKLGELMAFYILLTFLYSPIRGLAESALQIQTAMASVDRVFEYLDVPPAVIEDSHPVILSELRGEIEFRNVSFAYDDSAFRIPDLSLRIHSGEKVALVGPSGSGKTTLANLLMRFFDPDSGHVTLDGVDMRRLALGFLRDQIALVDQDPLLFKGSILDNIAYGRPKASREIIEQAARVANIHEFIMALPEGYQSEIGERGVTVSGGEKQRLCLARAILKNPRVLILDEATSALDSVSEQLIQDSLAKFLVGRTAVMIAHRLATVQNADRIVALDNGRIVDQGRHDELTARCPLYRELAEKQLLI
ncbi:MAG: ABC transporter ATP-binding protein [Candidatus Zixiibacteriota bacterium]